MAKKSSKSLRLLTPEEELAIATWCRANPKRPINVQIRKWMKKYNCTQFSILQVFVKDAIGKMPE